MGCSRLPRRTFPRNYYRAAAFCAAGRGRTAATARKTLCGGVALPEQSDDPEQEYFVDGLVEDITSALSCIRQLFVIARSSAFTYKGRTVDIRQIGRELGVRYVLEGSVRKSGTRLRITGQLIDAESGAHLWANHFDGQLNEVFELRDRITLPITGATGSISGGPQMRLPLPSPTPEPSYQLVPH